jgi:hypothetical protein
MSPLGIYRHYKGPLYQVVSIARHTETLETLYVYHCLIGDRRTWTRPVNIFESNVIYNGKTMKRFTKIDVDPLESPPDYR